MRGQFYICLFIKTTKFYFAPALKICPCWLFGSRFLSFRNSIFFFFLNFEFQLWRLQLNWNLFKKIIFFYDFQLNLFEIFAIHLNSFWNIFNSIEFFLKYLQFNWFFGNICNLIDFLEIFTIQLNFFETFAIPLNSFWNIYNSIQLNFLNLTYILGTFSVKLNYCFNWIDFLNVFPLN